MTNEEFINISVMLRQAAFRSALAVGINAMEGEDVAQDTMLRLWTMRERLSTALHAKGMAIVVARNLGYDLHRGQHTLSLNHVVLPNESAPAADAPMEQAEDEAWLCRQMCQLPSLQHQVLHLRQVERKSNSEIAAILGISVGSVATLLSRARKRMLEQIRKYSLNNY